MIEFDDMVAKSLSLKVEYNSNSNQQLFSAIGQSDRSVNSYIRTK
jgi:hypothetical protein